jgi:predicted ATPase
MESQGAADQPNQGAPALDWQGAGLATFIDYLLRWDRKRFDQIQGTLKTLVPGFEEIRVATPAPERRSLWLSIEGGLQIPGQRLSTGVRMLLFFVALAHHPTPPDVVLVEEPENGVHPKRLKDIVDLLRSLSLGKLSGKAVQTIMTTHSPYLLDQVAPADDQVIVFKREADGSRSATAVDTTRLKAFLDEFMLGEVWFNQGEEGLLASR